MEPLSFNQLDRPYWIVVMKTGRVKSGYECRGFSPKLYVNEFQAKGIAKKIGGTVEKVFLLRA